MNKFTYGYIREATMAHLDLDESEAQAMDILKRFPIYANEAMQAICAAKPKYEYVDVTIVEEFAPLVLDGANFILATDKQIAQLNEWLALPEDERPSEDTLPIFANETQLQEYWHEQNVYKVNEKITMEADFITFANKRAIKYINNYPNGITAKLDDDFSYIGKSQLKFYKVGKYSIPAKFMWCIFESGISDDQELHMPADILSCIPLYIAAICLQIDNPARAQIKRSEFEMALARCVATDYLVLNSFDNTW